MNWSADSSKHKQTAATKISLAEFSEEEQTVLKILLEKKAPVMIDELSWKSSLPVSQLASILLNLEFSGILKSLPGKQYDLVKR
jgi:DNA processing protein